jgi:hypothetical protein
LPEESLTLVLEEFMGDYQEASQLQLDLENLGLAGSRASSRRSRR